MKSENVIVLGASPNPSRYSFMALQLLREKGHRVIPVNPGHDEIAGIPAKRSLAAVNDPVDTVTVYVNPELLRKLTPQLVEIKPRRVILNPGTEDESVTVTLESAGIEVLEACTLVLLRTGKF